MLRKSSLHVPPKLFERRGIVVAFFFCIAVLIPLVGVRTAYAGSGSIPTFSIDNQLNVTINVSCPGNVGFTWQVAVDNWNNIVYEEGSAGKTFRMDGTKISNGHHNGLARVRCNGEPTDWSQATSSTVGFDWYGGNPTPVPPPAGSQVSISIAVDHMSVPRNTEVRITVQAACSNTTVRAIRIKVNDVIVYELGSPVVTYAWSSGTTGPWLITAEAACNGDDSWKTTPQASLTITVTDGGQTTNGGSTTGTAGGSVSPTAVPPSGNGNGSGATCSQAQQKGTPGGFDLITVAYCWGYGNVHNDNGRWDGWVMDGGGKSAHTLTKDDFNSLCQQVYGSGYAADFGNGGAGDIRCVTGGGNNPPSVTGGGNQPSGSYDCSGALAQRLSVGGNARVINGSIRLRPAAMSGDVITSLAEGTIVTVIGGSQCGDFKIYWWQVKTSDGAVGWVPEGRPDAGYWMEPTSDGPKVVPPVAPSGSSCTQGVPPPTRMSVGMKIQRAQVTRFGQGRIRSGAGQNNPVVRNANYGEVMTIIGGPTQLPASIWWQVKFDDGFTGWAMESFCESDSTIDYYFEPAAQAQAVATAVPVAQQQVAFTSYEACRNDLKPSQDGAKRGLFDLLANGFSGTKLFACDPNGEMAYTVNTFGGAKGEVTQEASAITYVVIVYQPNFTGTLTIEADVEVNGKATNASSTGLAVQDAVDFLSDWRKTVWNAIADFLTPEQLETIRSLVSTGSSVSDAIPTSGYIITRTFMTVITDKSYTVFDNLDGQSMTVFPTGPFTSNISYSGKMAHLKLVVPVVSGRSVEIHVGLETVAKANGWSLVDWNLRGVKSYVRSIFLTSSN